MNEYDNTSTDADLRYVVPERFLMSTDCQVQYILTTDNRLLDAHELEVIKAGARFRYFGSHSADNLIGSRTTRGELLSFVYPGTGRIEHCWAYDN